MNYIILILFHISIIINCGFTQICRHKLDGDKGKIQFPISKPAEKLPKLALKGEDLSNRCIFFKNIDKKKLSLKFKNIALNDGIIKIQTIKRKPKWKGFREISGKSKKVNVNLKGFKYVKITVEKTSAVFEMEYALTTPPVATCQELSESIKTIKCSKSNNVGSKCSLACSDGYAPNQFIKKSEGNKFTVTCKKFSAKKGVWKPILNKLVCGKGRKTIKECKKRFALCVPVIQSTAKPTSSQSTRARSPRKPTSKRPKVQTSRAEVTTTSVPTTATPRVDIDGSMSTSVTTITEKSYTRMNTNAATSKSQSTSTLMIAIAEKSYARMNTNATISRSQSTTIADKSYARSNTTAIPNSQSTSKQLSFNVTVGTEIQALSRSMNPLSYSTRESTEATVNLTVRNKLPRENISVTTASSIKTSTVKPTPHQTSTEPTPPPLEELFRRFPELNPFHKKTTTTKTTTAKTNSNTPDTWSKPPAYESYGYSRSTQMIDTPTLSPVSSEAAASHYKTNSPTMRTQGINDALHHGDDKLPTMQSTNPGKANQNPHQTTDENQSTVVKKENELTTMSTTESVLTSNSTYRASTSRPSTTSSIQTTEAITKITITSSTAPSLDLTSTTASAASSAAPIIRTKAPTTAYVTTKTAPNRNKVVITRNSFFQICRKVFCGRSAITKMYARTCQSFGSRTMRRFCYKCRSHPATPCRSGRGFP